MEKKGYALLSDAFLSKGTAFTKEERKRFGLTGLLPPQVDTIEIQAQRIYRQMERKTSDIEKRRFLMDVFNRNRTLFFHVFREHIVELMPIVYDPVIAERIVKFASLSRQMRKAFWGSATGGRTGRILRLESLWCIQPPRESPRPRFFPLCSTAGQTEKLC